MGLFLVSFLFIGLPLTIWLHVKEDNNVKLSQLGEFLTTALFWFILVPTRLASKKNDRVIFDVEWFKDVNKRA